MSHLIATPIVDRNGKQTTVYKKDDSVSSVRSEIPRVDVAAPKRSRLAARQITEKNSDEGTGTAFKNNYLSVELVPSRFGAFTTVKNGSGGGAAVIAYREGKVLMVSQPRYSTGEIVWEIPRGGAAADEDFAEAALRELEEETGERGTLEGLVSLGNIQPDTGILNTEAGIYMATSSSPASDKQEGEEGEIDNMMWVDADELVEACVDGTIKDSFTCVAIMRARLKGLI